MKDERLQVALLESLGWTNFATWHYGGDLMTNPAGREGRPPRLTLDLMHEAEKTLGRQEKAKYVGFLMVITHMPTDSDDTVFAEIHASKEQKREAYLKVKRPDLF